MSWVQPFRPQHLVQAAVLATALSTSAVWAAAPTQTPALSTEQQARAEHLKDTLRCPICTGESINESTNDISREMRAEVERMVAEGQSNRQVYDYFSARYGQFVLLDPPKQGANLLLWAGPLLALGAGGWWLLSNLKTSSSRAATAQPSSFGAVQDHTTGNHVPDHHSAEAELRPYLEQVQREVRRSGETE